MKNFVDNEDTMNIALFDSQAASHNELDTNRKCTIDHLKAIDLLVMNYASARLKNFGIKPYEVLGSIPQATGRENANDVIKNKKLINVE
jgi:phage anti-repressor protein